MKNLSGKFAILTLICTFSITNSFGQKISKTTQSKLETQTLYRGYQNKVSIGKSDSKAIINSTNSDVSKTFESSNVYIVVPKSSDTIVILNIVEYKLDQVSHDTIFLSKYSKSYPVKLMPKMSLCLGNSSDGQKINLSNFGMSIKFPAGTNIPIEKKPVITNWVLTVEGGDKSYSGTSPEFDEAAINCIKNAKKKSKISVSVVYTIDENMKNKVSTSSFIR